MTDNEIFEKYKLKLGDRGFGKRKEYIRLLENEVIKLRHIRKILFEENDRLIQEKSKIQKGLYEVIRERDKLLEEKKENKFSDFDIRIKDIFNFYGEEAQKQQVIQELAELVVALTKNDVENIHEEIADVEIMIEQLKLFQTVDVDKIKKYREFKLDRQMKRIEN